MDDLDRWYVAEAPRKPRDRLFLGRSVRSCLDWAGTRCRWPAPRVAIWAREPRPDDLGLADAFVCIPARFFEEWEARAAEVVDAWDARWLLVGSASPRHRDEARAELVDAVATALAAAASAGSVRPLDPDDVGF